MTFSEVLDPACGGATLEAVVRLGMPVIAADDVVVDDWAAHCCSRDATEARDGAAGSKEIASVL